jgi:hypothetical protein
MSKAYFKSSHFQVISNYRNTLAQLSEMTDRVKADLGLTANEAFIRLHQPSIDNVFLQARGQLQHWPELFEWPNRGFYQQMDLVADIRRFDAEYSRVLGGMSRVEREGFLSSLDFSRAPYELNGVLKVLSPAAGFPFAQQTKQHLFNLWHQYDGAAFTCSNLYQDSSLILPRLIDFMDAAINAYASANGIDPLSNDHRIVAVRALMQTTRAELGALAETTRDLSEGYSNLASLLSGALGEFANLYTSATIEEFQAMVESAMIRLELAEELIGHTRQ